MDLEGFHIARTDLTEQTYVLLRERILRRELNPGERISVDEVARALGVSRTPVMDALKRLAADGLVEVHPRRGSFVSELTARDVEELFDIRIMIELYAAERVVRNGNVDRFLANIQDALRGMDHSVEGGEYRDYQSFITNDRNFHLALVVMTENRRMVEMYKQMNVHIQVARAHYLQNIENALEAQHEHQAIVRAFQSREVEAVRQTLHDHISTVKTRILDLLEDRGGKL
jgi:DNA-binding GntR family transcriptional regulator